MTEHDTPPPPRAVCAHDPTHWLSFERNWVGEMVCACTQCEDADHDGEGYYRTDPVGYGKTAADALEDYCERLGIEAKELLQGECHV